MRLNKYAFRKISERCPDRTLKNIFFWTWPIHLYTDRRKTALPRVSRQPFGERNSPSLLIRTTKYKGATYRDIPLSNFVTVAWYGVLWGWRVDDAG